jgi:hypothetical protein
MYSYRYHVITMVGIFMALGIGILLGGILMPDLMMHQQVSLLHRLETRYDKLSLEYVRLKEQALTLQKTSKQIQVEMEAIGNHYTTDKLTGKQVLILNTGQADPNPLCSIFQHAGGIVAGVVEFPQLSAVMNNALDETVMKRLGWNAQIPQSTQLAETVARSVLENKPEWFQMLQQAQLIALPKPVTGKPDAIVLLGGIYHEDITIGKRRVEQLDRCLVKQLVPYIPVIGVEQTDSKWNTTRIYRDLGISTVNNIDHMAGQVACVDLLNGRKGHFGTGQTVEALLPDLNASKEVFQQK